MATRLGGLLVTVSMAGCVDVSGFDTESNPEAARFTQPIVNGDVHDDDPAAVFVWLGGSSCTGTLVSPRVVLTARHCLDGVPVERMSVLFGNQADDLGPWVQVTDKLRHPDADIGLITLAEVGPTSPVAMNTQPLEPHVGAPVRLVGFGVTGETASDSGRKRAGTTALHDVDGPVLYTGVTGSGTCYGDSGGPNFMTIEGVEVLAGVTSFGTDACGTGLDGAVNVASFHPWAQAYVDRQDPPPPPDPDVLACRAGNECRPGCPVLDVDCCLADGACHAACGEVDPDCEDPDEAPALPVMLEPGPAAPPDDVVGGCSASGANGQARTWWLLLIALAWPVALAGSRRVDPRPRRRQRT